MFEEKAFERLDATPFLLDAAPSQKVRTFPVFRESLNYEQLAIELTGFFIDKLGQTPISKNTVKNKWLSKDGRVTRIYTELDVPPLKTESGRITPFGIAATAEFVLEVHFGTRAYEDYVADVRSRYPTKVAESKESEQRHGTGAMVLHRGATLSRWENTEELSVLTTYKHVETDDVVQAELSKLDALLNDSEAFDELIDEELIQQAIARGAKRGAILARVEIAAAERTRRQAVERHGKKHGLELENEAS